MGRWMGGESGRIVGKLIGWIDRMRELCFMVL